MRAVAVNILLKMANLLLRTMNSVFKTDNESWIRAELLDALAERDALAQVCISRK